MSIDFPADLIELERSAWAAAQRGELTPDLAAAVQAGITAFAEASPLDRYTVEMALKRTVRHPEPSA
ncbi:hypothetical protein ACIPWE_38830 [Streptomyces sp. NPDC090073]|uniref:hypothetical protein n=1 Tax=Streptomyces sp. NPDC090073 TaxID=3365936 RepID=UPI00382FBC92